MSALKTPEVIIHDIFSDYGSDMEEILSCLASFLKGDCGDIDDEDEVLGFMRRSVEGKIHHGAYQTCTGGWVHVVGDNEKILVMPDIIYSQGLSVSDCSINTCTCDIPHTPTIPEAHANKKESL